MQLMPADNQQGTGLPDGPDNRQGTELPECWGDVAKDTCPETGVGGCPTCPVGDGRTWSCRHVTFVLDTTVDQALTDKNQLIEAVATKANLQTKFVALESVSPGSAHATFSIRAPTNQIDNTGNSVSVLDAAVEQAVKADPQGLFLPGWRVFGAAAGSTGPASAHCSRSVKNGETLRTIAAQYRTSWLQLWSLNDFSSADDLKEGDVIRVGNVLKVQQCDAISGSSTDGKCEDLAHIADRFGVTIADLHFWNKILEDRAQAAVNGKAEVYEGDMLCILPQTCVHDAHISSWWSAGA